MVMGKICKLCDKYIHSTALYLQCDSCNSFFHIKCLPNVNKTDDIYQNRHTMTWFCILCIQNALPFNHYDDDCDFFRVLTENSHCHNMNVVSLQALHENTFNPFELNFEKYNDPTFDLDPDLQYLNETVNTFIHGSSDYFLEENFIEKCSQLNLQASCFSIINFNIRSLPRNGHKFQMYLNSLKLNFSVITLCETWLSENNVGLYSFDGYKHEYQYRQNRSGGGVSIFIKDNLDYLLRDDLTDFNDHLESLFIELPKTYSSYDKNIVIGIIYRPPGKDVNKFIELLDDKLAILVKENNIIYLTGDFNINLLNTDKHVPTSDYLEMLYTYNMYPLINKPTRVKQNSASLIDNIFTNISLHTSDLFSGILYTDISDHFPIFTIINKA